MKMLQVTRYKLHEAGSAILFVILLLGAMLAITLTLAAAFLPKIRQSVESKQSINAIYAAESGIEWCLYLNRKGSASEPVMSNDATRSYYHLDNSAVADPVSYCPTIGTDVGLRVLGTYQNVSRALELSF